MRGGSTATTPSARCRSRAGWSAGSASNGSGSSRTASTRVTIDARDCVKAVPLRGAARSAREGPVMHSNRLLLGAVLGCLAAGAVAAQADTDTVVVKLAAHAPHRKLAQAGMGRTVAPIAGTGARLVRVSGDPAAAAARLSRTRGVRWAEPNFTVRALGAPNDA